MTDCKHVERPRRPCPFCGLGGPRKLRCRRCRSLLFRYLGFHYCSNLDCYFNTNAHH